MKLMLKAVRKKSHISQTELANAIGVSLRTVGAWEREENMPNAEQIWNCAVALGTTPNDLLGWYEEHPRDAAGDADPAHEELARCYDACTPERRDRMLQDARERAFMSREFHEPAVATDDQAIG